MADPVRIHTSTRITVREATDIEWRASADDGDRHAFPRQDGYPARAICGTRWTAAYGRHGASWCLDCLAGLREQLRAASAALAVAEREDLAAGDHYAYPEAAS